MSEHLSVLAQTEVLRGMERQFRESRAEPGDDRQQPSPSRQRVLERAFRARLGAGMIHLGRAIAGEGPGYRPQPADGPCG
ncbi:MAG: hypothetical protein AVDCRST_MAG59-2896 [uncultured Thermomicrobiales bacterium]|uniref:Uncharacterized protein n=1 Tax=uncultured Thermomicrobiales bacterium TaxID=1645740 RepID=A0A6J4V1M0_9BACT|nr:MAG: hypothetical protein AVDCRST_MAG59-2896 [uncultured Thermomicrobiales bacterium]